MNTQYVESLTMAKPGCFCHDIITSVDGTIVKVRLEIDRSRFYLFQPRSLNPETGAPADCHWLVLDRLKGTEFVSCEDLPFGILGTKVIDQPTGFTGVAVAIEIHVSGCVHVEVKPPGLNAKTGASKESFTFDIYRLAGDAIPVMNEKQTTAAKKAKPSPTPGPQARPNCRL